MISSAGQNTGVGRVLSILTLVFVSQMSTATVVLGAPDVTYAVLVLGAFYLGQFFGAPVQGHVSDNYHRQWTLFSAFVCIAVFQVILAFVLTTSVAFAAIAAGAIGVWGNGDVVARAALFDSSDGGRHPGDRMVMGLSFAVLAPPWIIVASLKHWLGGSTVVSLVAAGLAVMAALWTALAVRPRADRGEHHAIPGLKSFFRGRVLVVFLLALLVLEVAFQLVYLNEELIFRHSGVPLTVNTIIFALGFIIGCVLQGVLRVSDSQGIRLGIIVALLSVLGAGVLQFFFTVPYWVESLVRYGIFTVGSGIYLPCYYAYHANRYRDPHQHGTIFGLLESVMVLAEVIAAIGVFWLHLTYIRLIAMILLAAGYIVVQIGANIGRSKT